MLTIRGFKSTKKHNLLKYFRKIFTVYVPIYKLNIKHNKYVGNPFNYTSTRKRFTQFISLLMFW